MARLDRTYDAAGGGRLPILDPQSRLLQAALALLANNGQTGGLHGLAEKFRRAGLDDVFLSWIGNGENLPISKEQMQRLLGDGHLKQIAEETGMTELEAADHLSDMLPRLVDRLTPDGEAPRDGLDNVSTLLEQVMGRY
jgi:uncharacterized protein YidB (DUF937 family)